MYRRLGLGLTLVLFAFMAGEVNAQCTPDTDIQGLYGPTPQEGLPPAYVGEPYEAVISLKIPSDTTITVTFMVDSLVLTDVQGLPPGYSYSCSPPSCSFPGGDYGCILISGITFDNGLAGNYDPVANFDFYVTFGSISTVYPYQIDDYTLTLHPTGATAVAEAATVENLFFIEPNPVSENSRLIYTLPEDGMYSLSVYSLLGAEVASVQTDGVQGKAKYSLAQFAGQPGVYFVNLRQDDYSRSLRFVVK